MSEAHSFAARLLRKKPIEALVSDTAAPIPRTGT